MTEGWQAVCYGAAVALYVLAALAAWAGHRAWPLLIALGLASVTFVALWNAASAT